MTAKCIFVLSKTFLAPVMNAPQVVRGKSNAAVLRKLFLRCAVDSVKELEAAGRLDDGKHSLFLQADFQKHTGVVRIECEFWKGKIDVERGVSVLTEGSTVTVVAGAVKRHVIASLTDSLYVALCNALLPDCEPDSVKARRKQDDNPDRKVNPHNPTNGLHGA